MRIITGSARGTRLATLTGDATRPTAERVKEAVFSMLQSVQGARVLDLYAGSGQLALEALSRGAASAVLCDASRAAVSVIRSNAEKTHLQEKCDVRCMDAGLLLSRLATERQAFDLVFLDPPYAMGAIPSVLSLLSERELLARDARIVCESATAEDVLPVDGEVPEGFVVLRTARYGAAFVTVLLWKGEEA